MTPIGKPRLVSSGYKLVMSGRAAMPAASHTKTTYAGKAEGMVDMEVDLSNQLFSVLEEWNHILKDTSIAVTNQNRRGEQYKMPPPRKRKAPKIKARPKPPSFDMK